ncbi:hypothetical protein DL546_008196 [Coniochaeta pulveracea]|uniref:Aminoglycoside phosphotransferase domain-containing protein n=1 Tax=Coniochaeta pulveracea TaxID=177199 RepID=A0A420YCJ5_9PEZI|nr:hypothetical protein DL546_008196 [Coniochaeta pulveracea]
MAEPYRVVDLYQGRSENDPHDRGWVPWERRKDQLVQIIQALWPDSIGCKIFDRLDASSNEAILFDVNLPSSDGTEARQEELVIRLPRQGSDANKLTREQREKYDRGELPEDEIPTAALGRDILDSVAIHQHVTEVTTTASVPVPKVIAYDSTKDNLFRHEYLIMQRIPGQVLEDVLDDLSANQRKILAIELGEITNALRRVTSPDAGYIRAAKSEDWPAFIHPGHTIPQVRPDIIPFGINCLHPAPDHVSKDSNLAMGEIFHRAWTRRLDEYTKTSPQDTSGATEYRNLRAMAQEIVDDGQVLNTGQCCLWHGDLFPRNIMVDVEASPMITGIIDWDEAIYAPTVISAVPPFWLWLSRDGEDEVELDDDGGDWVVEEMDQTGNDEGVDEDHPAADQDEDLPKDEESKASIFFDEDETVDRANEVPEDAEMRWVREAYAATVGDAIWASSRRSDDINLRWIFAMVARDTWSYWWFDVSDAMIRTWKASKHSDEEDVTDASGEEDSDGDSVQGSDKGEDGEEYDGKGGDEEGSLQRLLRSLGRWCQASTDHTDAVGMVRLFIMAR